MSYRGVFTLFSLLTYYRAIDEKRLRCFFFFFGVFFLSYIHSGDSTRLFIANISNRALALHARAL